MLDGVEKLAMEGGMEDFFRVVLLKLEDAKEWNVCANPSWGYSELLCSALLKNEANKYAEYLNCGLQHRMIRARDYHEYFGDGIEANPLHALDPRER